MNTITIDPGGCAARIIDIHGKAGREWLRRLPTTISECASRWLLDILPPFEELSYNYVTPATTADGMPVVVKAGVPSEELTREIQALRVFDGNGIVRLLDSDIDLGVMLLERLEPGEPLAGIDNDESLTRAVVLVMQQLWTPVSTDHRFASVQDWAAGLSKLRNRFDGDCGPFPNDLVDTAQELFMELRNPLKDSTLIHGDLHPQNILSSQRMSWMAIDPKGVVGDPLYDVATFACSLPRLPAESDQKRFLNRRLDQLTDELDIDRQLIARWGLAHAVLSGWWSFEDHGEGWEWAFARARLFESVQKG